MVFRGSVASPGWVRSRASMRRGRSGTLSARGRPGGGRVRGAGPRCDGGRATPPPPARCAGRRAAGPFVPRRSVGTPRRGSPREDEREHLPAAPPGRAAQVLPQPPTILVVRSDLLPPVPPGRHVGDGPLVLDPQSSHPRTHPTAREVNRGPKTWSDLEVTRRVRKHSLLGPFVVNRFVPRQLK